MLTEHYYTDGGFKGQSLNIFDKQSQQWPQTWVDNSGTLLDGGIVDGSIVMIGMGKIPQGNPVSHKISWTANANGTVQQHWQTSQDDGQSWSTSFDGLYT